MKKAHLCFPRLPEERLVCITERRGRPREALAAADARRALVSPVVARADSTSVKILSAVRHGGCPFPDDCQELVRIKVFEAARCAARSRYMLGIGHLVALASASSHGVRKCARRETS